MVLLDLILNLAALLLWLSWRASWLAAPVAPSALSIVSTLKRAEARELHRWPPFIGLVLLVAGRSLFYWQLGPEAGWIPTLHLGAISLPFRADRLSHMMLFSCLSFGKALAILYLCLLLLSAINSPLGNSHPIHRQVLLQIGLVARWPVLLQLALVPTIVSLLWIVFQRPLLWGNLLRMPASAADVSQQAAVLGLSACLIWELPLILLIAAHLINSFVFLGHAPLWQYLALSGRNAVRPLRRLPLTIGRLDLAPPVAMGLIWLIAHFADLGLNWLFVHPLF